MVRKKNKNKKEESVELFKNEFYLSKEEDYIENIMMEEWIHQKFACKNKNKLMNMFCCLTHVYLIQFDLKLGLIEKMRIV